MSGRKSKSKGYRGEIALRDQLRNEGFEASRIPLSGAMAGYKGDVSFSKGGQEWRTEVKCRKNSFDRIYLVSALLGGDGVALNDAGKLHLFSVHISMQDALDGCTFYRPVTAVAENPKWQKGFERTLRKIANMRPLMQDCDVLCIKSDHKPFLFIRYRESLPGKA